MTDNPQMLRYQNHKLRAAIEKVTRENPKALEIARSIAQRLKATPYDGHSGSPEQRLQNTIASLKQIQDNLLGQAHALIKNDPALSGDLKDML
jgi:uncharacterized alpha-E superfamily protein